MDYNAKYKTQKRIKVADIDLTKKQKSDFYNSGVFTRVYQGKGKNNWIGYVLIDVFVKLKLKLKSNISLETQNKLNVFEQNILNSTIPLTTSSESNTRRI